MARVRYLGNEPATVPELDGREVQPDEVVEVPDERFGGYVMQTQLWEPIDLPDDWQDPAPVDREPETQTAKKTTTAAKRAPQKTEG